jgi:Flp pilus assembly protein TadG
MGMIHYLVDRLRDRRGQSMVEFALVLPILLLVVFGATEFGRAWMTMNIITAAARGPDIAAVNARVTEVCTAARVVPTVINCVGPDPLDVEQRVTVTVQTNFRVLSAQVLGPFNGTFPLTAVAVMRHEAF